MHAKQLQDYQFLRHEIIVIFTGLVDECIVKLTISIDNDISVLLAASNPHADSDGVSQLNVFLFVDFIRQES